MTVRFTVSGRVQGVGFRYFALRQATALGLYGWVTNLPDGRVEVVARGPERDMNALAAALTDGPPHAVVSGIARDEISDDYCRDKTFDIK